MSKYPLSLCMKNINKTVQQMARKDYTKVKEENISIVERILMKTGNPKLAAVLALDLMLVGVDTVKFETILILKYLSSLFQTSIAAASTIYQLSQNPEKQEKLYQELKKFMPQPDTKITADVQSNISYVKACIKETLRMYPVIIGNGRSLTSDAIISGYRVPKGVRI